MTPQGVRRSSRMARQVAILLIGSDAEGKVFSEETKTVVLSRHGAGILSRHKLAAEQELILRREETNREAEVRVIGQIGSQWGNYTYGVAFVDRTVNIWEIDFPPWSADERRAIQLPLECIRCKSQETLDHGEMELDVYAINQSIVRYCKSCGYSTVWKRAVGNGNDQSVPSLRSEEAALPGSPTAAAQATAVLTMQPPVKQSARPENRRKNARVRVNLTACIRVADREDDIVCCEDMSRGGFCFKSRKRYSEASLIEAAVPYAHETSAIFVPAQIVHVEKLPEQELFRCGVAFLRSSKTF
jgi:hypothetical protein